MGNSGSHVAFLYDPKEVVVYELASRTAVFKASYADATDYITGIHFVASNPPSSHAQKSKFENEDSPGANS